MKVFFDCEFTGLHKDTTLLSIGLISEKNQIFYAEFTDYAREQCNTWILENVFPGLATQNNDIYIPSLHVGTKQDIKTSLKNWFRQFDSVELVSDVCHYDMVLLIDIFGDAFSLPSNVCPGCYDINQDIARYYNSTLRDAFDVSREEILFNFYGNDTAGLLKHNALDDAKVIKYLYEAISKRYIGK